MIKEVWGESKACYNHCSCPNHTRATCWKPRGTTKPKDRQRDFTLVLKQVYFHASVEECIPLPYLINSKPVPFSKEQLDHLYEPINQANHNVTGSCSIAKTDNAHTTLHVNSRSTTSWVIDSGDSDHVSGNLGVFISYSAFYENLKVKIANGECCCP